MNQPPKKNIIYSFAFGREHNNYERLINKRSYFIVTKQQIEHYLPMKCLKSILSVELTPPFG